MIYATAPYKTPTELFLSAAAKTLSVEETLLMETQRSGYGKSYASAALKRYEKMGYLRKNDRHLEITPIGLDKLNHPTKRGLKSKTGLGSSKSPEEIYGTFYPFYPKEEECNYSGDDFLFKDYTSPTERLKYIRQKEHCRTPQIYAGMEGLEIQLFFERDNDFWAGLQLQ
jgi:hypothetical protein